MSEVIIENNKLLELDSPLAHKLFSLAPDDKFTMANKLLHSSHSFFKRFEITQKQNLLEKSTLLREPANALMQFAEKERIIHLINNAKDPDKMKSRLESRIKQINSRDKSVMKRKSVGDGVTYLSYPDHLETYIRTDGQLKKQVKNINIFSTC